MTVYVTTPPKIEPSTTYEKVFMGGGIGECPDWQNDYIMIQKTLYKPNKDFELINPRWKYQWTGFQQIQWEHKMLKRSDAIIMWFSRGGQNRIVFYELGLWINSNTKIPAFIGCDPEFDRKEDVAIQTHLARPQEPIYTNLQDIARAVDEWVDRK